MVEKVTKEVSRKFGKELLKLKEGMIEMKYEVKAMLGKEKDIIGGFVKGFVEEVVKISQRVENRREREAGLQEKVREMDE